MGDRGSASLTLSRARVSAALHWTAQQARAKRPRDVADLDDQRTTRSLPMWSDFDLGSVPARDAGDPTARERAMGSSKID